MLITRLIWTVVGKPIERRYRGVEPFRGALSQGAHTQYGAHWRDDLGGISRSRNRTLSGGGEEGEGDDYGFITI